MSKSLILLLALLLPVWLSARDKGEIKLYFRNADIRQGLSNQLVNALAKDSLGFVWIGTAEGLNRYDGTRFQTFRHEPGNPGTLSTSWINSLYITRDGSLLAGTEKGVNIYNPEQESFSLLKADNDTHNLLGTTRIRCFCEDSKGLLWIGTLDGLLCLDRAQSKITFHKLNPYDSDKMHNEIRSLCEDAQGDLWIGTFDGLYHRNSNRELFERIELPLHDFNQNNLLVTGLCIQPHSPHLLYAATSAGLYVIDIQSHRSNYYDPSLSGGKTRALRAIIPYDDDHLLLAGSLGLSVFDIRTKTFTTYSNSLTDPVSLPAQTVTTLFQDRNGMIWIGTTHGLSCCNRNRRPIDIHYVNTTDQDGNTIRENVTDLAVLSGEIWIGTDNGLRLYTADMHLRRIFTTANSTLPHNNIKRLLLDRHGTMWIGTNNGVVYLDRAHRTFRKVETDDRNFSFKYVYDIKEDNDGEIVVNISSGVCFIRAERDAKGEIRQLHFRPMYLGNLGSSDNSDVPYFDPDLQGNLWIGSISDGIFRYDKARRTLVQYKNDPHDPTSIVSDRIYTIHTDRLNRTWIGTDAGLCRYDPQTDGFERIETNTPLSVRTIVSDDDNRLWITTGTQLVMFDYELNYKITYDISQELKMTDIEYNSVCTANGRIYLGGYGGYIDFNPREIKVDVTKYPIRLTSLEIHNARIAPGEKVNKHVILDRSITLCDRLRLRHDENVFRINFALLNYAPESENRYVYKLEGYDKEWTTTDGEHSYASYSHIPPGRYTFLVNAVNPEEIWSENQGRVEITITPAWYRSNLAYILYTLLIAGLCGWGAYLVRIRMRLSRELKFEIMRRENDRLLNQAKTTFFTNISHEFKTPLSLILGPIEQLLDGANERQRTLLLTIRQNAERLLRLINQIMDMRKIDNHKMKVNLSMGDLAAFSEEIFDSFREHARERRIGYTFTSHPFCINMLFDRDKVEKMIYNLLSNAFKFTPDGGCISLEIDMPEVEEKPTVRISVSDTGCGIAPEDQNRIFDRYYQTSNTPHDQSEGSGIGLALTRNYAELLGGNIHVDSTPEKGSRFTVTLPYRKDIPDLKTAEKTAEETIPNPETPGDTEGSRAKIVLVEDNEQMLEFLRSSLSERYEVYTAKDGKQGLEEIRRVYPDLIVSDLMMPRMDGFEMCRLVREESLTCHIPFIMLTAKSDEADRVTSYNCGADAFLSKPFSIKTLTTRIEGLIASRAKLQELYRKKMLSDPSEIKVESENDKFILHLVQIVEANFENPDFNIQMLCDALCCSYQYVYRKVKALTGETVNDFIRTIKLKRAAQYLCAGELRISEILYKSGFNSHSYFTKCFKKHFGMTPREYVEHYHTTNKQTTASVRNNTQEELSAENNE